MNQELEAQIAAEASKAPRVTPAMVNAEIASEHYFTAADGFHAEQWRTQAPTDRKAAPMPLELLTFCVLVLRNGFTVTGESACASPDNFNVQIGRQVAREKAVEKIWPLLGFRLRDALHVRDNSPLAHHQV